MTFDVLDGEYSDNPEFVVKIGGLKAAYATFRRMRADGNCFYRAFTFGMLEHLILNNGQASTEAIKAKH
jgi:ubiquitin thioesterase protein OTUB1